MGVTNELVRAAPEAESVKVGRLHTHKDCSLANN